MAESSAVRKKLVAVLRRGLPSARNKVFSWFNYWPTSPLRGHWLQTIPAYCISLQKATKRRALMARQASALGLQGFVLIDAVSSADLAFDDLESKGLYSASASMSYHKNGLTLNEIACSLSHAAVYQRIVESKVPWSLVLEDDVLFWTRRLRKIPHPSELPDETDIVFLNAFLKGHKPEGRVSDRLYSDVSYAGSAAAYLLSQNAARTLLSAAIPVVHAADGLLGRCLKWDCSVGQHEFRQVGVNAQLNALIVHPEAAINGSVEHYYSSAIRPWE